MLEGESLALGGVGEGASEMAALLGGCLATLPSSSLAGKESAYSSYAERDVEAETAWQKCTDPATGATFYYDPATKRSCWTHPASRTSAASSSSGAGSASGTDRHDIRTALLKSKAAQMDAVGTAATKACNLQHNRTFSQPSTGMWKTVGNDSRTPEWVECFNVAHNAKYYYNRITKESVWQRPKSDEIAKNEGDPGDVSSDAKHGSAAAAASSPVAVKKYRDFLNNSTEKRSKSKLRKGLTWSEGDPVVISQDGSKTSSPVKSGGDGSGDWVRTLDPATGLFYLYNEKSRESIWEHSPVKTKTDDDWEEHVDPATGAKYLYSRLRKESKWEVIPSKTAAATEAATAGNAAAAEAVAAARTIAATESVAGDDWEEHIDAATGAKYMYSKTRRESKWIQDDNGSKETSMQKDSSKETETETSAVSSPLYAFSEDSGINLDALAKIDVKESFATSGVARSADSPFAEFKSKPEEFMYGGYVWKQGGGSRYFGRRNWKRRYVVIAQCHVGMYKTYKDYASGKQAIKNRWIDLREYRLEEVTADELGFRVLPPEKMTTEMRTFNFRAESKKQKREWLHALDVVVGGTGILKSLDKYLNTMRSSRPELN